MNSLSRRTFLKSLFIAPFAAKAVIAGLSESKPIQPIYATRSKSALLDNSAYRVARITMHETIELDENGNRIVRPSRYFDDLESGRLEHLCCNS